MKKNKLSKRTQSETDLIYRTVVNQRITPETIDEKERSVEIVAATEEPAEVFDWDRWEVVDEVLLMSGAVLPRSKQVPLLDSHQRYSTSSVIGSVRSLKKQDSMMPGKAVFSSVDEAENPWIKVKEGHLTDFSVAYKPLDSVWIEKGESQEISGRTFKGPLKVTKKWKVREISVVPIGADELAKARSQAPNNKSKTNNEEVYPMDPKLRKFLESRGLDKEADEKEAWKFLQTLDSEKNVRSKIDTETKKPKKVEKTEEPKDPSNKRSDPDPEKIAQNVLVKERERVEGVRGLCEKFGANSIVDELIRSGASVEDAKDKVLAIVEARMQQPQDMLHRGPATMGEDARDKFRNAAVDSLLVRIGQAPEPEKRAIGYDELTGFSLKELARESLRMAGQSTKGRAIEMVGRALTTADLPYIMANVANKSLSRGWETAPETWRQWVPTGQFNDFKQHSMVRASEASDLDEVPEHGEYRYGKRAEQREVFTPATYGKLFSISRQAIINDDTGALSNIPRDHGMAASRKVADVVYAVLTANAAMGDGLALFVAGHSNYVASGSGAAPGQATIAAGVLAMGTQKDIQGLARLNIRPEFFIAPKALEGGAEVFFNSFQFSDSDTIATDSSLAATRYNVYSGTYFTRVYESRLDDALATGWYLAAGMQTEMTVKVFFLDGVEAPYLEEKQGWNVDGVEYKVRIDAVAKALDWRGLYFNYGA